MKKSFLAALLGGLATLALTLASPASAQQAEMTPGTYQGDIHGRDGSLYTNVFQINIKSGGAKPEGTLIFYQGYTACRTLVSIQGTAREDELRLSAPGVVQDCSRTLVLKATGPQMWEGDLTGPGGERKVVLKKIQ